MTRVYAFAVAANKKVTKTGSKSLRNTNRACFLVQIMGEPPSREIKSF